MKHARWWIVFSGGAIALIWSAGTGAQTSSETRTIAEADCTAAKLGDSIPVSAIGEPVSGITLSAPRWNPPGRNPSGWCSVNGSMAPVDHTATAKPINFQVAFPATWNGRAVQLGGGGMNGTIPMLAGAPLTQGLVTYGSDSGHQASFGRGPARGATPADAPSDEGAAENAPPYNWIGVLGATGFLMQDLQANALDYVEGGKYSARRQELSAILDSSNPDFSAFVQRGGKMIVAIGNNDTLASPGTQLDFYQAILNKMGWSKVDSFARFYVLPQTGHGLTGTNYTTDGDGKKLEAKPIPNTFDRLALLTDWVEKGAAPGKAIEVTAGDRSLPMCSYPEYPKYIKGPAEAADSWQCSAR